MYNLNINNNSKKINDLHVYMLNSVTNISNKISENETKEFKLKKDNSFIPKSNIYVNYNKFKSKYSEKTSITKNKLLLNDKLFWCFYKIYNNVNDDDLQYINIFTTEKEFKLSVLEKIKANKDLLKKHKIQKTTVETEITNNKYITLNSFKTLCILYNLNIIVINDNNTYLRFTNNFSESCITNIDNYYVIKIIYNSMSHINSNFDIIMNVDKSEIENAVNKFYYIKNIDKPLKSLSSYKLIEIVEIANKLDIILNYDNGKKKTKMELYSECCKKIS